MFRLVFFPGVLYNMGTNGGEGMYRPLADELRPKTLDDVCGQGHILGEDAMLRRIIESGKIPNLIFYGPSGIGKTTVANIIAARTNRKLCKLNAELYTVPPFSALKDASTLV